jgi:hypothetical protein
MAGYSGTPLPKKLGIKTGHRVALISPPRGIRYQLDPMPEEVELRTDVLGSRPFNVIVCFTKSRAELESCFVPLADKLSSDGGLWIAWPKKASGVDTDLTEDIIRVVGLDTGLVDNKVCAIDDTWSGLRFVIRVQDRPKKHS